MSFPPVPEQLAVLCRGCVDVVSRDDLERKLARSRETGTPLRVKFGIDPSSPDIHVGHTVPLRKLRDFQQLGHTAIVLWGTTTAMVGDPTGKDKTRPTLTRDEVEHNKQTYKDQIGSVLDVDRIEERENGEWFDRMSLLDAVKLCGRYTVARVLERESFAKRYKEGQPISMHEMLYPLLQGWDSVELRADVELGGSDQLFNLMVGRTLQEQEGQEPQVCLTMPLLEGLDGERKMSKSLGNAIGVLDSSTDMFGKTMSIPDGLMEKYFTLLTDVPEARIRELLAGHPREAKVQLAQAVVASYHGVEAGRAAFAEFERVFKEGALPDDVPDVVIGAEALRDGVMLVAAVLVHCGICKSNGEGRRLIQGGAVRVDDDKVGDPNATLGPGRYLVRSGKRKAAHVSIEG